MHKKEEKRKDTKKVRSSCTNPFEVIGRKEQKEKGKKKEGKNKKRKQKGFFLVVLFSSLVVSKDRKKRNRIESTKYIPNSR